MIIMPLLFCETSTFLAAMLSTNICVGKMFGGFYFIQASSEGIQGNFSGDLLQSGGMLIVAKGNRSNVKKKKKKSHLLT